MKKEDVKRDEMEIVTKTGVKSSDGRIVVPMEYDFVTKVNDNLFAATKGSVNGLCRQENRVTYQNKDGFLYDESFENETLDTEVEFYSKQGKFYYGCRILGAIPCKNDDMLLVLHENYKWSMVLLDYQNQIILDGAYVDVDSIEMDYYNNRFIICLNDHFVITSFKEDCRIANTTTLLDGKPVKLCNNGAVIKKNGKYGFVDYKGKLILTCMYDEVIPRKDTIQTVTNGGVELFNYNGKFFVGGKNYDWCQTCYWKGIEFFILGHKDGTYCLWTSDKQLLACEYSSIEMCGEFAIVCKDERYGLLRYDKESDEMVAVIPKIIPDGNYIKMRFDYTKAATYVMAEEPAFPINRVYRLNLADWQD